MLFQPVRLSFMGTIKFSTKPLQRFFSVNQDIFMLTGVLSSTGHKSIPKEI